MHPEKLPVAMHPEKLPVAIHPEKLPVAIHPEKLPVAGLMEAGSVEEAEILEWHYYMNN